MKLWKLTFWAIIGSSGSREWLVDVRRSKAGASLRRDEERRYTPEYKYVIRPVHAELFLSESRRVSRAKKSSRQYR